MGAGAGGATPVLAALDGGLAEMVETRRHLHAHPELSFEEFETTELVKERLARLDVELLPCPTPTGAVGRVVGGRPGRTVLLRADIDALPVDERTGLAYASRVHGKMHACGHDAHTAVLLGVAGALAASRDELPGSYLFVFQLAEERISGAQAMVDAGLLEAVAPDAVVGMHVVATMPPGTVATRAGVLMAGGSGLEIVVSGTGGHGAMQPRQGNVVLAASHIATRLASVVEGMAAEGTAGVCSPGMMRAGTAPNVVPTSARLAATFRWFDAEDRDEGMRRLRSIAAEVAADFDVEVSLEVAFCTGPVRNDEATTAVVLEAVGRGLPDVEVSTMPSPIPASDDVSVLLERVPGCYLLVGAAPGDRPAAHHSPTFAIDERAMRVGAGALAAAALRLARPRQEVEASTTT